MSRLFRVSDIFPSRIVSDETVGGGGAVGRGKVGKLSGVKYIHEGYLCIRACGSFAGAGSLCFVRMCVGVSASFTYP